MVPAPTHAVAVPSWVPRTVVLEHSLPDGTRHFDWLIESAEPGPDATDDDRSLLAFRVGVRIDEPSVGAFRAEALPAHRRLYLHYEGAISGDRGAVIRVADGACRIARKSADEIRIEVEFRGAQRVLVGLRLEGGVWAFGQEPA